MKIERKPTPALLPTPVVLVSVAGDGETPNIITIAWVGTVCSSRRCSASPCGRRATPIGCVNATREFVVNVPRADQLVESRPRRRVLGRRARQVRELGLTAPPASHVGAPLIAECPVNIECVVRHQLHLGTHDLFLGEVVAVQYDEEVLDERGPRLQPRSRPSPTPRRVLVAGRARLRVLRRGRPKACGQDARA